MYDILKMNKYSHPNIVMFEGCIASNGGRLVNVELNRMWKEAAVA
jgi:hypothetical protein